MYKSLISSVLSGIGTITIVMVFLSLIDPSVYNLRVIQSCAFLGAFVSGFQFLVSYFKLFSRYLWVRRAIVLLTSFAVLLILFTAFGIIDVNADNKNPIIIGIVLGFILAIFGGILGYFIADKINKRALDKINQKLEENE
ncbi:MAG: hypothetical protein IJZ93_00735 [Clostridia bacterium]|nr:hypothetical protein [Clostridia bacterium]